MDRLTKQQIAKKLNTFVLVEKDTILSPPLTTTREYGRWLQENFDEYTCNYELYLKAAKTGKSLLEYHPGTRLGKFFDGNEFRSANLQSWYIYQSNNIITRLVKLKLIEMRDCVPVAISEKEHRRMLRVYTTDQIELYIRNNLDKNFTLQDKILVPKQIKLTGVDKSLMEIPKVSTRKSLLDSMKEKQVQMKQEEVKKEKKKKEKTVKLTLDQIEKELGYKIKLVENKEDKNEVNTED